MVPSHKMRGVGTGCWGTIVPAVIPRLRFIAVSLLLSDHSCPYWCLHRQLHHLGCVVQVGGCGAGYSHPTAVALPAHTPLHKPPSALLLWPLIPVV